MRNNRLKRDFWASTIPDHTVDNGLVSGWSNLFSYCNTRYGIGKIGDLAIDVEKHGYGVQTCVSLVNKADDY